MSLFLQDAAFDIGHECGEWHNASQDPPNEDGSESPIRYFLRGVDGGPRTEVFPSQDRLDEISTRAKSLETTHNSQAYKAKRREAYTKLNQDELRYDDEINGTTTWIDAIKAIKKEYPKP